MSKIRVRYQTIEFGDVDIHVRSLRDSQEHDEDSDATVGLPPASWSLFGLVWDSGIVLARIMFEYDIGGRRVLEIGCGLGLTSLVLNHRHADITATDYHPDADEFLQLNASLNDGDAIPFVQTGWLDDITDLGSFDLIVGSDLLYERSQVESLSAFIEQHANAECEVIIVDPRRGNLSKFDRAMEENGFTHTRQTVDNADGDSSFRGTVTTFLRSA